jgi:hypothetical protein
MLLVFYMWRKHITGYELIYKPYNTLSSSSLQVVKISKKLDNFWLLRNFVGDMPYCDEVRYQKTILSFKYVYLIMKLH